MKKIESYRNIVGDNIIEKIYDLASSLKGMSIVHINSTQHGGGVAEILSVLIPLLNDVGIEAEWRVLHGTSNFFEVTKSIHNALQGDKKVKLNEKSKRLYIGINRKFSVHTYLYHDFIVVHDPQPLPLIKFYKKVQPWIWRCHIDISNPNMNVWNFVKRFLPKYNLVILSNEEYIRKDIPVPQRIVCPAIDPLSEKNKPIMDKAERLLGRLGIPLDKPIIAQISRFDKWKDPLGVIEIFKKVKEKVNSRLILCGSMASDDPEGIKMYQDVKRRAKKYIENSDVILLPEVDDLTVNALQTRADVIIQKSLREGFGLTVTEAMWKEKAVVASRVGGIKLQIIDGKNGFLIDPNDTNKFAKTVIKLLKNRKLRERIGKNAKETVRKNFLITRLLQDHLSIMKSITSQ